MIDSALPIILKVTSQKTIGYREHPDGGITIIENVGVDIDGKWWKWRSETLHRHDGMNVHFSDYMWLLTSEQDVPAR